MTPTQELVMEMTPTQTSGIKMTTSQNFITNKDLLDTKINMLNWYILFLLTTIGNNIYSFMVQGEKRIICSILYLFNITKNIHKFFSPKIMILSFLYLNIMDKNIEDNEQTWDKIIMFKYYLQMYLAFSIIFLITRLSEFKTHFVGIWLSLCVCHIHAQNITLSPNTPYDKPYFELNKPAEKIILKTYDDNIFITYNKDILFTVVLKQQASYISIGQEQGILDMKQIATANFNTAKIAQNYLLDSSNYDKIRSIRSSPLESQYKTISAINNKNISFPACEKTCLRRGSKLPSTLPEIMFSIKN